MTTEQQSSVAGAGPPGGSVMAPVRPHETALATPAPPPRAAAPAPPPGRPPRGAEPRSALPRMAWSIALIAVGLLGLADLAGAAIPASAYLALPLVVVGAALVAGAWYGRARSLIALGAVLSGALAIVSLSENADLGRADRAVTWRPTSIASVSESYRLGIGDAVLDLSAVRFTDPATEIEVQVGVGDLLIVLPPNVDAVVRADVDVGQAVVFGQRWSGLGQDERSVADDGADGPGGGEVVITATVDVGELEVRR